MTFPDWWPEAWYKIKLGVPITKVAAEVGVSRQTVHTYINRHKTMKDTNNERPRSTTETGPQTTALTNVSRDCTSDGVDTNGPTRGVVN